jgi:hypothetical protein
MSAAHPPLFPNMSAYTTESMSEMEASMLDMEEASILASMLEMGPPMLKNEPMSEMEVVTGEHRRLTFEWTTGGDPLVAHFKCIGAVANGDVHEVFFS